MADSLMRNGRAVGRLCAFSVVTVVLAGSLVLAWIPTLPLGPRGRAFRSGLRRLWTPVWSRWSLRSLGSRLAVEGHVPPSPFLLATNHLGYLDVLVLGALAPIVFVAKREVRSWPVLGALARLSGTVFVDRDSPRDAVRVIEEMDRTLDAGDNVVLFPEGTSSDGRSVLPMKSALLVPAARSDQPLYFGAIQYRTDPSDPPASDAVCWWGDHEFGPHFWELLKLKRVEIELTLGPTPLVQDDRKQLAASLETAISDLLVRSPIEATLGKSA